MKFPNILSKVDQQSSCSDVANDNAPLLAQKEASRTAINQLEHQIAFKHHMIEFDQQRRDRPLTHRLQKNLTNKIFRFTLQIYSKLFFSRRNSFFSCFCIRLHVLKSGKSLYSITKRPSLASRVSGARASDASKHTRSSGAGSAIAETGELTAHQLDDVRLSEEDPISYEVRTFCRQIEEETEILNVPIGVTPIICECYQAAKLCRFCHPCGDGRSIEYHVWCCSVGTC